MKCARCGQWMALDPVGYYWCQNQRCVAAPVLANYREPVKRECTCENNGDYCEAHGGAAV